MVPTDQCFRTFRFKGTSTFEIFVKSEKSMIIDSHFKAFIINHGPQGILVSLLIIDDLANVQLIL